MRERKWVRRRRGGGRERERWGEKAFYGNGADSGLSQLCSLESLFVHNHSGITWICPPPSLHTNTHSPIVIYRQRHIYRYTQVRLKVFPFIRGSLLHFFFFLPSYLDSDVELGSLLGGSRRFINGSVQIHWHGEDRSVNWARLGEQAIL